MTTDRLADGVAECVAHLHGVTLDDLLAGRMTVPDRTPPSPVPGVEAHDLELAAEPAVRARR